MLNFINSAHCVYYSAQKDCTAGLDARALCCSSPLTYTKRFSTICHGTAINCCYTISVRTSGGANSYDFFSGYTRISDIIGLCAIAFQFGLKRVKSTSVNRKNAIIINILQLIWLMVAQFKI